jgi:hypothetical protein
MSAPRPSRRQWLLQSAGASAALGLLPLGGRAADKAAPLPVAAVVTEYRPDNHADVIVGKILAGWRQDGGPGPNLRLVALWTDQIPKNDLSRSLAEKHGFRIAQSIDDALAAGTDRLQVAGVLSIGEHGTYPKTEDTQQTMYPRKRFFDEIVATFRRCGQVVPVFNDKHLAYRWSDAKAMYDTARELKIPFLAGSSVPVGWRAPETTVPLGAEVAEAMAVGYGGLESYGFHALEGLQCLVERRKGGETGVAAVQVVSGEGILQAEQDGRWSRKLLVAALAVQPEVAKGPLEPPLLKAGKLFLIEYRDGLRACMAMLPGIARHFSATVRLRGRDEPLAVWYRLEEEKPYGHFAHLLKAIEHTFRTGRAAYPVERTLLTTGILDESLHSHAAGGARRATPELAVRYEPADWPFAKRDARPE